jgi:uncharacterized membrane protein YgcG
MTLLKNPRRLGLILAVAIVLMGFSSPVLADEGGYTTPSWHTEIAVREDHAYDITETIRVNFSEARHGIYRYIPNRGTFYRQINGRAVATGYRANITRIKVTGGETDVDARDNNTVIRIGSSDATVIGNKTYVIRYRWDPGDDGITDFDDVYFNLTPRLWPTAIGRMTFRVSLPKNFSAEKLHFYSGEYGSTASAQVSYRVDGQTITGQVNGGLNANQTLTINLRLPEGYFVSARKPGDRVPLAAGAAIIALIAAVILFWRYGRDEKPVMPVFFNAPHGFDPAQVGTIVDGSTDQQDILAMIIYLASRGYLTIEETADGDFTFHRQKDLPADAPAYTQLIYNSLFPGRRRTVTSGRLADDFYQTVREGKTMVMDTFHRPDTELFTSASQTLKAALIGLAIAVTLFAGYAVCYAWNGGFDLYPFLSYSAFLGGTLLVPAFWLGHFLEYGAGMKASRRRVLCILFGLITAAVTAGIGIWGAVKLSPLMAVPVAAIPLLMLISAKATKRTPNGHTWLGEVLGFKHFIELAEADRLRVLLDDNPTYFYDVLPYAYVLGVTDQWAKRFESLAVEPPSWYSTYRPMTTWSTLWFASAFSHGMTNMSASMIQIPSDAGSGGFGGGGFGGGGGFSGGGGGGGGGGSW